MESESVYKIKQRKYKRFYNILNMALFIIIAVLVIFAIKHLMLSMVSVDRSGVVLDTVIDVIRYHTVAFFESFSDLTGKYMLLVTLLLLINLAGNLILYFNDFPKQKILSLVIFGASIAIVFNIPLDRIYSSLISRGKTLFFIICLITMIPLPALTANRMARFSAAYNVINRLLYVLIFGLLAIQLFMG